MAINNKTDTTATPYVRAQFPIYEEGVRRYIQDELQRIENSLRSANEATIQVADKPPDNPLRGMVRYAISPWDALGNGYTGLVVYTGNTWAQVQPCSSIEFLSSILTTTIQNYSHTLMKTVFTWCLFTVMSLRRGLNHSKESLSRRSKSYPVRWIRRCTLTVK